MVSKIKKVLKPAYYLSKYKFQDWKRTVFYQYFPAKPEVVNLNANDICNSKCTMCNIWQQKQGFEFSPDNLKTIFEDKLFQNVQHVGITGGEPTLRKDLPALYEAACISLPNLKGLSIITNAIQKNDVIQRISEVAKVCEKYQINFSIMVSLDGYGKTHDAIRGREGNFESAWHVIKHFRENTKIPVAIGCTLSKNNLWEADELLDFLKQEQIYGRFRVAEFIKRLYNDDRGEVVRNFNEEEGYHLACFFKKLEMTYEPSPNYQRTYRSIIHMLTGGQRQIACPYHSKGVVLDARADLHYCAPKSANIGNSLKESAHQLFNKNLKERRRLLKENCSDCIHDYHAPITYKEQKNYYQQVFWSELLTIGQIAWSGFVRSLLSFSKSLKTDKRKIYIVGWYGTETVGDKAILGGIIQHYKDLYGEEVSFYIASIHPFVSEKTIREIHCPDAQIIPTGSFQFVRYAKMCDEIVMGGGPLMDMESLAIPLWAFKVAKMFKKKTVIFGCGLGPLHEKKYIDTVKEILHLADEIKLRDNKSVAYGKTLVQRQDITNSGDSAEAYVRSIKHHYDDIPQENVLACFLREWTTEYKGEKSLEAFLATRKQFEEKLAMLVKNICRDLQLTPVFYPMHSFVVGNDDRDFYRRFTRAFFPDQEYQIYKHNASIDAVVRGMKSSRVNLCMRFHSVLFAHTLDTNFLAIDYTNGGKITGFLTDKEQLSRMVPLQTLAESEPESMKEWYNGCISYSNG